MACCKSLALSMFFLLCCFTWVSATDYTVGDMSGWTTGVDYTKWTSDKTFAVGDNLVFNYASVAHTVTEVSQSDYSSCSANNAISNSNSNPTTITLNSAGTHYFICGVPGHCSAGMKLAVKVESPSSGSSYPSSDNNYSGSFKLGPIGSVMMALIGLVVVRFGLF
ncbi:hypothetical protein LUZ60_002655 [Juncus effusus]|nr:hypothetical protein LUZ60_002655 [Juncus effusus]